MFFKNKMLELDIIWIHPCIPMFIATANAIIYHTRRINDKEFESFLLSQNRIYFINDNYYWNGANNSFSINCIFANLIRPQFCFTSTQTLLLKLTVSFTSLYEKISIIYILYIFANFLPLLSSVGGWDCQKDPSWIIIYSQRSKGQQQNLVRDTTGCIHKRKLSIKLFLLNMVKFYIYANSRTSKLM